MENNELLSDLTRRKQEGNWVKEMVETRGWTDVLLPVLLSRKEALTKGLLNAKEYTDFLTAQQALNTINFVLDTIVGETIKAGEEADMELEQMRDVKRKEIVDT